MNLYRIRWRDGVWQAVSNEAAIAASEDRDQLIQLTRKVAARHAGELYVCDEAGKLELAYIYSEGAESVRLFGSPRLRVVRDS
jgi:hypothetical protein